MNYIGFRIYLEEPVKMGTQGNQANNEALPYIAGSSIRGAVINELVKKDIDDICGAVKKLFFYDAYVMNDNRCLIPIPSVYYANKHDIRKNDTEYAEGKNVSLSINTRIETVPAEGEQRVNSGGYGYLGDKLYVQSVKKIANMHISMKKDMYRYEAIAEGQTFFGVIASNNVELLNYCETVLSDCEVYVGGSKGSGYGRCRISNVESLTYNELLAGYGIKRNYMNHSNKLYVYALSNLILVDSNGCNTGVLSKELLSDALGIDVNGLEKSFVSTTVSAGFNHKWKAGNVKQTAVKAGSVYVYSYNGELDENKISVFEQNMVGLRKNDGFGRIVINPVLDQTERVLLEQVKPIGRTITKSDEDIKTLQFIQNRVNNNRIQKFITEIALECSEGNRSIVKNFSLSQIARLYSVTNELVSCSCSDEEINRRFADFYKEIFTRENVNGEIMSRTSNTRNAYRKTVLNIRNVVDPSCGVFGITMEDVIRDLKEPGSKKWIISNQSISLLDFDGKMDSSLDTELMLKVRFLRELLYDLMRKEGRKK